MYIEEKINQLLEQNKTIEELLKNILVNNSMTDTENLSNEHRNEDLLLIRGLQGEIDNQNQRISSLQKELDEKDRIIAELYKQIEKLEKQEQLKKLPADKFRKFVGRYCYVSRECELYDADNMHIKLCPSNNVYDRLFEIKDYKSGKFYIESPKRKGAYKFWVPAQQVEI